MAGGIFNNEHLVGDEDAVPTSSYATESCTSSSNDEADFVFKRTRTKDLRDASKMLK